MRSRCLGLALLLAATGFAQAVPSSQCTADDSKRASDAADKLHNWEAVHKFYKTYLPCDDGGIAEAVSDAITKLLADKWLDFWRLQLAVTVDQQYSEFIVKHIDGTVSIETLQAISKNARDRRPKGYSKICKKIDGAASSAINESQH